ncbi:hypothetical protein ACIP93_15335 [Streptomyces sp. NPDC088745]|uniref:hypothetical protein n=1 Tax=Streptomyces sp. NPDC088745 TaxID=3365884 RepID=UPI0037F33E60
MPHHEHELTKNVAELRALGYDFAAFHLTLEELGVRPGTEALAEFTELLHTSHQLTVRSLEQLTALATGPFPAIPGSNLALDALSGGVACASAASTELARAISDIAYDSTPRPRSPTIKIDAAAIRLARHQQAAPLLHGQLASAADHVDVAATVFHYLATTIAQDIGHDDAVQNNHRPEVPQELTPGQVRALRTLALGEGRWEMTDEDSGHMLITTKDGSTVTNAAVHHLLALKLISAGPGALHEGQALTLTRAGEQTLAHHTSPTTTRTPLPALNAAPAPTAASARGAHR